MHFEFFDHKNETNEMMSNEMKREKIKNTTNSKHCCIFRLFFHIYSHAVEIQSCVHVWWKRSIDDTSCAQYQSSICFVCIWYCIDETH